MSPSTLRQRQQQRQREGKVTTPGADSQHLDFIADKEFEVPVNGIYRGRLVKISARGNTSGMSATWLITDERGKNLIVSLADVTMTDAAYIPPPVEQLEGILLDNLKFQE